MNAGMWVFVVLEALVVAAAVALIQLGPQGTNWGADMASALADTILAIGPSVSVVGLLISAAVHYL